MSSEAAEIVAHTLLNSSSKQGVQLPDIKQTSSESLTNAHPLHTDNCTLYLYPRPSLCMYTAMFSRTRI